MNIVGYEIRHKLLEAFGHYFDGGYLVLWGQPCYFSRPIFYDASNIDYIEYSSEPISTTHPVSGEEVANVHTAGDQTYQIVRLNFWDPAFGDPVEGQMVAHNLAAENVPERSEPWQHQRLNSDGNTVTQSGNTRYQKFTRTTMYNQDGVARVALTMKGALENAEDAKEARREGLAYTEPDLILRKEYAENGSAFTLFRFSVRLW